MSDAKPTLAKPSLSSRTRLITLLSGGAAVAYALLVFLPQQQAQAKLRGTIRQQQSQILQSQALIEPTRELQKQLAATEEFARQWRRQAPPSHGVAAILAQVSRHAKAAGAEIVSITPQPELPLETVGRIPVSLQAAGSYRSLHEFLERLETLNGVVWIEELKVEPHAKAEEPLSCTLKLIIFSNRGEISG
jgi:Tfp pilus assembly protein PilO